MLLAELAAKLKAEGLTLHEKLEALFWQHGFHTERLVTQKMTGSEGMARMKSLMATFRSSPPKSIGGLEVARIRDYQSNKTLLPAGTQEALDGPAGNMVIIDLSKPGNYVAVRPSGTEPKVKFYAFAFEPAEQIANLDTTKQECEELIDRMGADLAAFADTVK